MSQPPATQSADPLTADARSPRAPSRVTDLGGLVQDTLPLLCDWLPRQRWFAGKGYPVTAIVPAAVTLLPGVAPGDPLLLHLLLRVEQRGLDGSTDSDLYQLLLGAVAGAAPARLDTDATRAAVIGRINGGPHDGLLTYDAAYDEPLTLRLLGLLTTGGPGGAQVGPLRFSNLSGLNAPTGAATGPAAGPGADAPARVGTAEQSNTSIVFGDTSILKLFRRVSPGLNPDLELSLALSRAGSNRVPATLAWFESELPVLPETEAEIEVQLKEAQLRASEPKDAEPGPGAQLATLGLLQRYLSGGRDGWEFALTHVRALRTPERTPERSADRPAAEEPAEAPAPIEPRTGNFSAESFLLGRSTAEVHLALARALPVSVLGRAEIEALAAGMALRLDAAALVAPALKPYQESLHRIFQALAESARDGRRLRAQRIHGDLHLGQSMRTARGWVLLDFEGEPAKPLVERRRPQPAVRDVAAMLRSFDYAAAHLLSEVTEDDPQRPRLAALAATWAGRNREAFLAGYAAAGAEDPTADPVLLHALETDKAVYEVVYESRNRPDWLPIPLSAIARLAAGG
ncbi:maltokinase [Streptacidiphilus sp. P02-A3a]|uniref:maltokinase N-terminal cap-like domain-containing protein n=1 Tax=Streptacidiphilus sp. P02-A3a TaxID=2704468 RepID=UPI001CDD1CD0|nr:maltokinase [Streptacidiphilus sp. P02-A3a]QMU72485.1 maltokinase [Streptacidiphilus sp. P02-A3a]